MTTNIQIAEGFVQSSMAVSETVREGTKTLRKPIGNVQVFIPTLAAFGVSATQALDKEGKPAFEDDLPVYTTPEANWLQGAILAKTLGQARNKLVPKSLLCKDGVSIASTMAELTAEGERGGNGAALAFNRELKALFAKWVASLGKSIGAQAHLNKLFGDRDALKIQPKGDRTKMAGLLAEFVGTLDEDTETQAERYIQSLLDICDLPEGESAF